MKAEVKDVRNPLYANPGDMKDVLRFLPMRVSWNRKEIELCAVMGPGSGFLWRHVN